MHVYEQRGNRHSTTGFDVCPGCMCCREAILLVKQTTFFALSDMRAVFSNHNELHVAAKCIMVRLKHNESNRVLHGCPPDSLQIPSMYELIYER